MRRGRGFAYRDARGRPVTDPEVLARIHELAIPPAWQDVWICSDARGHLQAVGTDAAGRRQYLYHPVWREQQDRRKFRDMEDFARALPRLRRQVHLALDGGEDLGRERVAACATRLLDIGLFRVGGAEYAGDTGGIGLATLTREHLLLRREEAIFDYPGKSGVRRVHRITDPAVLPVLRRLAARRSGPEELLAYREGREWHRLGSERINDYVKLAAAGDFSAKDFRTWNATVLAAVSLAAAGDARAARNRQRIIAAAIRAVSEQLGNTPAVARRSYVDPRVIDRYLAGRTIQIRSGGGPLGDLTERRRRQLELAVLDLLD
ncbi:MAG TPA: DNA topoisomerase IB [Solirubrobacteraceae bacterium]|nr:DNA topoisomerase IB [Solirubrobacteraceae bacterium]